MGPLLNSSPPPPYPPAPLFHLYTHNLCGWACLLMAKFYGQIKWPDRQNNVTGESVIVDITIVHIVVWLKWRLWCLIYAPILFISCPNYTTVKHWDFKMKLENISALSIEVWSLQKNVISLRNMVYTHSECKRIQLFVNCSSNILTMFGGTR